MHRRIFGRLAIGWISIVTLVGASCAPESSDEIESGRLSVSFSATGWGSGITAVSASMTSGDNDVALRGGDYLTAIKSGPGSSRSERRRMISNGSYVSRRYGTDFPGNVKDTRIAIELNRRSTGRATLPGSYATLPSPFTLHWVESPITRVPVPLSFSRSSNEPRFVIWDPYDTPDFEPGDALYYSITGSCIRSVRACLDWEAGEDVLELTNLLRDAATGGTGETCVIEVSVSLSRVGVIDSGFASGSFVARQTRILSLLSTP